MTKQNVTQKNKHKNKTAFYAIALLIPLVFFVILEFGLRLIGFGTSTPLFIENPANPHYILPQPNILQRYFPEGTERPSVTMEANFILKEKPANGYRIVVQGGSTAAGFPYGLGASIAGILDQRLKPSLPGRHVEVLNTAMSAVNSYTLLDIADEIIEQKPDAIMVYAGHNEFLGILGVGSNYSSFGAGLSTRWFLKLKDLSLFQLMQAVSVAVIASQTEEPSKENNAQPTQNSARTFMAKVAKHKNVEKGSDLYEAGLAQFEKNISALLGKYQSAGIPVFISTIASNIKDQKPFVSAELEREYKASAQKLFASIEQQSKTQNISSLKKASLTLQQSSSATLHFELAQLAIGLGETSIAKTHFNLAKEHDLLRFRAPEEINDIIREQAQKFGAIVVDSQKELEIRSPDQIVGNNLMLEHLHPNLRGYFVVANSFYNSFAEFWQTQDKNTPFSPVSIEQAWAERLILPQEEYFGYATILGLTSDYPFTDTPRQPRLPKPTDWQQQLGQDFYAKKITWLDMMEASLKRYTIEENTKQRNKTLQILADALPHKGLYNLQIAEIKFKQGRYNESLHYYQRAKLAGAIGNTIEANIKTLETILQRDDFH